MHPEIIAAKDGALLQPDQQMRSITFAECRWVASPAPDVGCAASAIGHGPIADLFVSVGCHHARIRGQAVSGDEEARTAGFRLLMPSIARRSRRVACVDGVERQHPARRRCRPAASAVQHSPGDRQQVASSPATTIIIGAPADSIVRRHIGDKKALPEDASGLGDAAPTPPVFRAERPPLFAGPRGCHC